MVGLNKLIIEFQADYNYSLGLIGKGRATNLKVWVNALESLWEGGSTVKTLA